VVEAAEIRRHWPALLDAVAAKHRYTWMLLTQFAQVTDVLGKVLWLEFRDGGSRDGFMKQGAQDLQEAIAEQLGADMLVRARVESDPPPTAEGVLSVVASRPPAAPAGAAGPAGPAARGPAGPGRDRAQSPALAAVKTPVSGTSAARRSPSSPALSPASAAKPAEPIPDDVAPDDKVVPLKEQAKEAEALIVATFGAELVREEPNTKA
jgi:DNA polymerase-3 subunit gamma/tau